MSPDTIHFLAEPLRESLARSAERMATCELAGDLIDDLLR
jgi:hypothetical protein